MNHLLNVVMGSLSNLNVDELNKVIEAAQRKKDKIETGKKRVAATDLVESFLAYREATGKDEIKLYDCINGSARTDVIVNINQLFVDDNGDICHKVLF